MYYQAKQNIAMYTKKQKQLQKQFWKHIWHAKRRKHISLQVEAAKKNIFILSKRVGSSRMNVSIFSPRTRDYFFFVFIEVFNNSISVVTGSLFLLLFIF